MKRCRRRTVNEEVQEKDCRRRGAGEGLLTKRCRRRTVDKEVQEKDCR